MGACWIYEGRVDWEGYGRATRNRRDVLVHRASYEALVGPIPDGLVIDHLCRNRACYNPAHLEPVTPTENNSRSRSPSALNARKTTCKNGHEFDEANTYWRPDGCRDCRACHRDRTRRRYAAIRAAA